MDQVERLIGLFRTTPDAVEAIVELEDLAHEARVVAFFVSVITDPVAYDLARIECIKILHLWPPDTAPARQQVGRAMVAALMQNDDEDLVRQYAARSLGPYADDAAVFEALTTAVLHDDDPNVRDNALGSLRRAGRDDRGIELLRRLANDPVLGTAADRILQEWDAP